MPGCADAGDALREENGPGDYWVDEKAHQVLLSEAGTNTPKRVLRTDGIIWRRTSSLYDSANILLIHHLYAALRAHSLFLKDVSTTSFRMARLSSLMNSPDALMSGRRWSDGLHQAVEAKEGVAIQNENQTLARSPSRTTSACTASWPA
jgi:preprotein translocase subunit SecA